MSFTSAIDLIANYTEDAHQQLVRQQVESKVREEGREEACRRGESAEGYYDINTYLGHINSCVQNLRDTNAFMLMTINRCIDYAKATKGVKLVPKQETIDLLDTMQLPLNCLRNVQSRLTIIQKAIPDDICSHIITDKQWLQENLLCLLSNAVKYSSKGEVNVSIQLMREHSVIKMDHHEDVVKLSMESNSSRNHDTSPAGGIAKQSENDSQKIISGSVTNATNLDPLVNSSSTSNSVTQSYWLLFEVEDSGIGVPEDAMKFLFQPFKQTQRLAGGTGLGLYSLAKRVEALNGEYGVKNRTDGEKGSVFWFTIPYRPDTVTASVMMKTKIVEPSSFPALKKPDSSMSMMMEEKLPSFEAKSLKILLVDDSLPIVKMTSLMLRKLGHRITAAENGEVAVKTIENEWTEKGLSFDIILMDLQMPVMDGLEATKRIRAMEGTLKYEKHAIGLQQETDDAQELSIQLLPRHFIVGLSANSDHETEWNAMDHGTDAFIAKPFTVDTFTNLINERFEF
jgi:signal transduction histidine kinase/CheY-like chemotaxis protein